MVSVIFSCVVDVVLVILPGVAVTVVLGGFIDVLGYPDVVVTAIDTVVVGRTVDVRQ